MNPWDPLILLVEDDPNDVALTMRAFASTAAGEPLAARIEVVRDGQEALDYLFMGGRFAARDRGSDPSMILLDLKLPRVNGLEVLRRVRADARTRTVPVVILTSSNHEDDLVTSYVSGANSYVRKPVDYRQFVSAMRQIALYWLAVNQPPPEGTERA